jgi:hypothetical protein
LSKRQLVTHSLLALEEGICKAFRSNYQGQCEVPSDLGARKIVQAAAGGCHSMLVLDDGICKAFGHNFSGQCEVPADLGTRKIVQVAAGSGHSLLVLDDGTCKPTPMTGAKWTALQNEARLEVLKQISPARWGITVAEDLPQSIIGMFAYQRGKVSSCGPAWCCL